MDPGPGAEVSTLEWPRSPDLTYVFGRTQRAVLQARQSVAVLLDRISGDASLRSDVLLVVSELMANVLQHAGTPGELRVWDPRPDIPLRIEVSDGNLLRLPTVRPSSAQPSTGGGLHLVDQIADCWGVDFTADRKTVWAEFVRGSARVDDGSP